MIKKKSPDILGIQEGLHHQVSYLDSLLADYDYVGVGREEGKIRGEYTAIFYRHARFELIETQTYWLSPTPDTVSRGWDAALERITTFARFLDHRSGDTLHVFNAHFDHMGKEARLRSAELILTLIDQKQLRSSKLVVMGDLNSKPVDAPIKLLSTHLQDCRRVSLADPEGPEGTFNGFEVNPESAPRIDYIFVQYLDVQSCETIDLKRSNGLQLSDHYAVFVVLK